MAYMNQEKKAKISEIIKPILKKYGVKGSLAVGNHSTIILNVKSGEIDFIGNYNATSEKRATDSMVRRQGDSRQTHIDVNPYWFQEHFTGKAKAFLTEAFKALKSAGWYDESNAQIDYFNTAYYVDINIGKWNKPYVLAR